MKIKSLSFSKCNLIIAFAFLMLSSCKKEQDVDKPATGGGTGEVVSIGVPDSSLPIQKIIGAAGGNIQSSDGELTVSIPQGALKGDQSISIQKISNTNPLGKNAAYRIEPHTIQFEKAVSISFKSNRAAAQNTLGIAYQSSTGIWKAVGGAVLSADKKTISVSVNHFSDWSLFDCLFMIPVTGTVQEGLSLPLEVFDYAELLGPLVSGDEKPIGKPEKLSDRYIKKWELIGPGSLSTQGAKAIYHAPDNATDSEHATVNVELDLGIKGKFILVAQIEILNSAVRLTLNTAPEFVYKSANAIVGGNMVTITAGDEHRVTVQIHCENSLGFHPFSGGAITQFGFFPNDVDKYVYFYTKLQINEDVPSGGGITINDLGLADGFIKGTFEIDPIGKVGATRVNPAGKVVGSFKVKKSS